MCGTNPVLFCKPSQLKIELGVKQPNFKGGKPLILYVCGQGFNLILTLVMAYIMFYVVFPEITAKI